MAFPFGEGSLVCLEFLVLLKKFKIRSIEATEQPDTVELLQRSLGEGEG